jgi:Tfp pilus assembly protein PilO
MSKVKEIWLNTIGSVHGADVNQELCFKAAVQLAAYAEKLEQEQSDLDWLEGEVNKLRKEYSDNLESFAYTIFPPYNRVLDLIEKRREAKP